ncbi:MAG: putative Ig protein [Acidimicrobiales bacterium]|nr:putative Ig protein [Acidimicrobiales bacterium]
MLRRRGSRPTFIMLAVVGLFAGPMVLQPAAQAVASPTQVLFRGDTTANDGEGGTGSGSYLRATIVILHPAGVTVSQMRRQSGSSGAGLTAYGAVEGTVRVIAAGGGNNYSIVEAAFQAGNCNCFTTDVRTSTRTARVDIKMSDNTVFEGNTWTYLSQAESDGNANDPGTVYDLFDSSSNASIFTGGTFRIHYVCDDNDSQPIFGGSSDECDNAIVRVRNVASNASTNVSCLSHTSGDGCENNSRFNADDNVQRNYTVPHPAAAGRGRFVIEGRFCQESDRGDNFNPCGGGSDWQYLGSYYFNPGAPTVSFGTTSFTGGGNTVGGVLRPFTNASVVYNLSTSSDAQVASWDLDNNGSFETVDYGESGADLAGAPVLSAAQVQRSRSTVGLTQGSSCAVNAQVKDNGGLNAADPTALTASASSLACTVNNLPTGANQSVNVHQGTPSGITLTNADTDNDARTCTIVSAPTKGTLSTGTSCSRTYTANNQPNTTDSFTYTVSDDHGGTSATTYTVSINIVNQAPTATAQAFSTDAGVATAITLAGTDPDGDTLTCTAPVVGPAKGVLSGTNCARSYTSSAGTANNGVGGADSFTFTVSDPNSATSAAATVGITIRNPDLSLTKSHTGRFNPGTGSGTYTLAIANTSNSTANGTTTIVDTLPAGMFFRSYSAGTSGFTCTGTPGVSTTVTCTRSAQIPKPFSGSLTITVDVDETAGSPQNNSAVISSLYELSGTAADNTAVDATLVNHRPVAQSGSAGTDSNVPVPVTLGATDPDGDPLTVSILSGPSNGVLSGSGLNRQYFPDTDFQGVDTFTFRVTDDNSLQSNIATVKVYVGVAGLSGLVSSDAGGAALAGIEVRLIDNSDPNAVDPALLATAVTNGSGSYDLAAQFPSGGVPYGDYVLRFVDPANNYISEYYENAATRLTATNVNASSETPVVSVDAALVPGGRIQGTVRSSAGAHQTVQGLQVRLVKIGSPGSKAFTTAANGQYKFELLTAGDYQLWFRDVSSGQWVSEWYDDQPTQAQSASINMTVGQQRLVDEQVDPIVAPPPPTIGTITGTVRASTVGNAPLAGIQVRLYMEPYTTSAATTTDGNGQYTFPNKLAGNYKIWFRVMSGGAFVSEYYDDQPNLGSADVIALGANTFIADALLSPPPAPPAPNAVIAGTITQLDGETPIAGIQVRLYHDGLTIGSTATYTDGDGHYTFAGKVPGDYQLFFRDMSGLFFSEWYSNKPNQAGADAISVAGNATTTVNASLTSR